MKITKGRWDDNVRIYNINPLEDWTEAIQVRMYRSLDTFKWEIAEIGSISFRGLDSAQAEKVAKGFMKASQVGARMFQEASSEDRLR